MKYLTRPREFSCVLCFVYFVSGIGLVSSQWLVDDEGCRTPDRGSGVCMPVKKCAPMVTLLQTIKRPISSAVLQRIQSYTCGVNEDGVKVCCPSGPINIGDNLQEPPDVSNHRNINLLPSDCGYLDTTDKIINGEDALLNEFPWMALLSYQTRTGPTFRCGGSIINKNYILTAAHCITNLKDKLFGIRVGEHSIRNSTDCELQPNNSIKCAPPVQDLDIEEVIPHPSYNAASFTNDIGLLRVSSMNFGVENVRPICLPLGSQRNPNFKNVVVTGWGITGNGTSSDILQKVELPIADKTKCAAVYSNYNIKLNVRQVCAGGVKNKDSCPGDSGGPMQIAAWVDGESKYIQQGIVSFGPRYCGLPGYPGVYTLIPYYMDWLLDTMRP
ncbi:phenoloxidase-activating factor 3-like [Cylas formicarius]|uniref:phenoloxidase-activating factor 3-like n=1 Tax=Cylas formicarius TaxID=197179 RepID=UPI002958D67A|nr:phenoloxidase-activating factor 3-like [Cylas formicarius]XP_060528099.1 phenoloxidase-activating factor 3-like [Cylas formicarius]